MAKHGYILIPDELVKRTDLAPSHKIIMGILGRLQGDKGSSWPSYDYLAKASGMSARQVKRIVADLKARKELVVLKYPDQASNSYSVPWATDRAVRQKWAEKALGRKEKTA